MYLGKILAACVLVAELSDFVKGGPKHSTVTCKLPADRGPNAGNFTRFYRNEDTKKCEKFIYGGSGGNGNNFERLEQCENHCIHPCWQSRKPGPGLLFVPRYYYNEDTENCERFIWGGKQQNSNNFKTKADCEDMCDDVCWQPKKRGPCNEIVGRYYYNPWTGRCRVFEWGGCEPNGNNFPTEEACEDACEKRRGRGYGHMVVLALAMVNPSWAELAKTTYSTRKFRPSHF